jgi:hypothetical protein
MMPDFKMTSHLNNLQVEKVMSECDNGIIYIPSPYGGYYEGHPCPLCNGKGCKK